jgi:ABC-type glycerol-3-phosphate transport system substrate-binding protein
MSQAMDEVVWDGVKYGVPLDIYTLVLIYNKAHFEEANLPYPDIFLILMLAIPGGN